jgi:hypothetical protein
MTALPNPRPPADLRPAGEHAQVPVRLIGQQAVDDLVDMRDPCRCGIGQARGEVRVPPGDDVRAEQVATGRDPHRHGRQIADHPDLTAVDPRVEQEAEELPGSGRVPDVIGEPPANLGIIPEGLDDGVESGVPLPAEDAASDDHPLIFLTPGAGPKGGSIYRPPAGMILLEARSRVLSREIFAMC